MITVKEEFLTEEKTRLAIKKGGCEAIVMWLAIKGYVARKNSNGFVPDEAIDELPGAPKHPRKALEALVECKLKREDGTLGAGLVDKVVHGWKLHDYEDHGTIKEVEDERRRRAREQKANRRAELARIAALRASNEQLSRTDVGQPPDIVRGHNRTYAADSAPDIPRPPARTSAPARAPSPAQPNEILAAAGSQDLAGGCDSLQRPDGSSGEQSWQKPCNLSEALLIPVQHRAVMALEDPYNSGFWEPSKWPEVQRVSAAWSAFCGIHVTRLRDTWKSDRDLEAILRALADGYPVDQLEQAAELAKRDEFLTGLRDKKRAGPGSFGAGVLRRLFAEAPNGGAEREEAHVWAG